jgi:hypothetical protein
MSNAKSRTVPVGESALYAALSAIAAVIEEPHCLCGAEEYEMLCRAHAGLRRAVGDEPEYRYEHGGVVRVGGYVIRSGSEVAHVNPV